MKILSLDLVNIQSHPKSRIDFHPNLNVIRAPSDSGKSVIIRGLKFVITNRASKNIRRKGTSNSEVIISNNDVTVGRYKDDKVNGYAVDFYKDGIHLNSKEFKALGKDIPYEVIQTLNLNENNIQEQKDTFFLLDESPGQVAKVLNKISGFSSIDAVLKRINSEITSITSDIRRTNSDIENISNEINDTAWAISADKELSEIESCMKDISDLGNQLMEINSLVESYSHYKNEINDLLPESIITDFDDLFTVYENIQIDNDSIKDISTLVNSFDRYKTELDSIEIIDLSEIESLIAEITEIEAAIHTVQALTSDYHKLNAELSNEDHKLEAINIQLSAFKLCPTCKRPM